MQVNFKESMTPKLVSVQHSTSFHYAFANLSSLSPFEAGVHGVSAIVTLPVHPVLVIPYFAYLYLF
jgi:hypothetical protein